MASTGFDVETLRGAHENEGEWVLRRAFLVAHQDSFPLDRLICLSNCFLNVEVYGCEYPTGVMQQLRELTSDLDVIQEFRVNKKATLEVKFMKAEEDDKAGVVPTKRKIAKAPKQGHGINIPLKKTRLMDNFVKPNERKVECGDDDGGDNDGDDNDGDEDSDKQTAIEMKSNHSNNRRVLLASPDETLPVISKMPDEAGKSISHKEYSIEDILNILREKYQSMVSKSKSFNHQSHHHITHQVVGMLDLESHCEYENYNETTLGPNNHFWKVKLYIQSTFVGSATGNTKKKAKYVLFEGLFETISESSSDQGDELHKVPSQDTSSKGTNKSSVDTSSKGTNKSSVDSSQLYEDELCEDMKIVNQEVHSTKVLDGDTELVSGFKPVFEIKPALNGMFDCRCYMNGALLARVVGGTSVQAKESARSRALLFLEHRDSLRASKTELTRVRLRWNQLTEALRLMTANNFVMTEIWNTCSFCKNAFHFLQLSFEKTGIPFTCLTSQGSSLKVIFKVWDFEIGEGSGGTKKNITKAFGELLCPEMLSRFWTIVHHQDIDCTDLVGKGASTTQPESIPQSNLGNKLLTKMGWTGGGLGSQGQGITEPVKAGNVINRQGLGASHLPASFLQHLRRVLTSYTNSVSLDGLVFDKGFTSDERKVIHNQVKRMGLGSKSRGVEPDRQITAFKKMAPFGILKHVADVGPEAGSYTLIPPTNAPAKLSVVAFI